MILENDCAFCGGLAEEEEEVDEPLISSYRSFHNFFSVTASNPPSCCTLVNNSNTFTGKEQARI